MDKMLEHYNLAIAARSEGDLPTAAHILGYLTATYPTEPLFFWQLGYTHLDMNSPERAVDAFNAALLLDCNNIPAVGGLGQCYLAMKEWDKAAEYFARRLQLRESANHYVFLAFALRMNGDYNSSISAANNAIRLQADNPEAFLNLGIALRACGRNEEALRAFSQATTLRPEYALAACEKAYTEYLLGDSESALQGLTRLTLEITTCCLAKHYKWMIYAHLGSSQMSEIMLEEMRNCCGHSMKFPGGATGPEPLRDAPE